MKHTPTPLGVRACNAHDDLAYLLKQVTASLEAVLQLHVPSDEANNMWPVLCQQARAALAKAEVTE